MSDCQCFSAVLIARADLEHVSRPVLPPWGGLPGGTALLSESSSSRMTFHACMESPDLWAAGTGHPAAASWPAFLKVGTR